MIISMIFLGVIWVILDIFVISRFIIHQKKRTLLDWREQIRLAIQTSFMISYNTTHALYESEKGSLSNISIFFLSILALIAQTFVIYLFFAGVAFLMRNDKYIREFIDPRREG